MYFRAGSGSLYQLNSTSAEAMIAAAEASRFSFGTFGAL